MARSVTASLDPLFRPRSVALVGVSGTSVFGALAASSLRSVGFGGRVVAINRRSEAAFGYPGFSSLAETGEPVDVAFMAVPASAALDAVVAATDAGARSIVMVSGGFAEVGPEGAAGQRDLAALCAERGVALLGPNSLGYFNLVDRTAVGALTVTDLPEPGGVAIVSASGGLASQMLRFCHRQGIGVSHAIATGNEGALTATDIVRWLIDQSDVRAIALFLEGIRDVAAFVEVALAAREGGKPIVMLKGGAGERSAAIAAAHTGAVAGDDAAFDALCADAALIRVMTLEDLCVTAALAARIGRPQAGGMALVSMSGGACEIAADLAQEHGLTTPDFSPATRARLEAVVAGAGLGAVLNPLDLTGAVARDPALWARVLAIIADDPQFGMVVAQIDPPSQWERSVVMDQVFEQVAGAVAAIGPRAALMSTCIAPLDAADHAFARACGGGPILPGLGAGVSAIARLIACDRRAA